MKICHEAATVAAKWWAGKIDGTCKHDNGDRGFASLMANSMADMLNEPVTEEQLQKFQTALCERLESGDLHYMGYYIDLYCDYSPDRTLREAADAAGISYRNFPFKTCMWLNEKEVKVRDGYGAGQNVLWAAKEE